MAQRTIAERNPPAGDHRFARLLVVENIGAPAPLRRSLRMTELPLGSIQIILALRLTKWEKSADARVT